MPLPPGWDGIFYCKDSCGDQIFDLDAPAFADFLVENDPDGAACLMANACFDLLWNQHKERATAFSSEGKRRWPDKLFGFEAVVVAVTREMIASGCDEKSARSGASNSMGRLFGGPVCYTYDPKDLIGNGAIGFEFEGQGYQVNPKAYELGFIRLPDGRLLRVDSWFETMPPKPDGVVVVETVKAVRATG